MIAEDELEEAALDPETRRHQKLLSAAKLVAADVRDLRRQRDEAFVERNEAVEELESFRTEMLKVMRELGEAQATAPVRPPLVLQHLVVELPPGHPMTSRTKAKIAWCLLSAPFLLMGLLYALAFRGIYFWPLYYALQPYWQPWMNEPWFYGLSVFVPAAAAAVYVWRFSLSKSDIIDWHPGG